jgi:flagellar motor switch protein FliN/FliY
MSDGALSQAEIDALLGGGAPAAAPPSGGVGADEAAVIGAFLGETAENLSANLRMMTGGNVTFKAPATAPSDRDTFLAELPEMVTAVKIDFSSGFPGEHSFLFSEDTAKAIASLMNKEENIQLDDMAMSVIGEMVSTMVGSQITALTGKTGNKSIANASPEAANVPKATVALPAGNFVKAAYNLDLGDGLEHTVWEIFGPATASGITAAIKAASAPQPSVPLGVPPLSSMPGMVGGGFSGPVMNNPSAYRQSPNVQSVQFPGLDTASLSAHGQGNIGLLMDVFMEMTVELGRTRKLIKEILGMGEGTIIELDKLAGEPVDILVNHKLIAKGEVVVIDENFGVRVTEIVSPAERMNEMS